MILENNCLECDKVIEENDNILTGYLRYFCNECLKINEDHEYERTEL